MKETTAMDKITEEMMEHVCDHLCRFPWEISDQEEMDEICASCEMGKHVCDILNEYNRLNNLVETEREKHRWIPVEEQLPSSGSHVLATFDDRFVATVSHGVIDEGWELWADSGEVIAWMRLPEPYQPRRG